MSQMNRIKDVFTNLRADNISILDSFYDVNVEFIDPIGKHFGRDQVKQYYQNLYKNVISIKFEYENTISEGPKHVLVWKMILTSKGLNGGKAIEVPGNSVIIFNHSDLVSYHRDYFDMNEFIYKNIPVLGWITEKINSKLKKTTP